MPWPRDADWLEDAVREVKRKAEAKTSEGIAAQAKKARFVFTVNKA